MERDDHLRTSCFASLDVLCATFGGDVPYVDGLQAGFAFQGKRVPFLSTQKGIFRAAVQRGPAVLAVQTSSKGGPYEDGEVENGFRYSFREGSLDIADNRALSAAFDLQVPIVYYVSTRPGWYRPVYPCFVIERDPVARWVVLSPGRMLGDPDEREPVAIEDPIERRYAVRETRTRLHQAQFRGRVLRAYNDSCTICRLKELRLLDAAHIVGDADPKGEPLVSNGLSLCSIHHRAFDQNLVGISPDYDVHVAPRLLEDEDGPMLELLKTFHRQPIVVPRRRASHPDKEQLADRFERFLAS